MSASPTPVCSSTGEPLRGSRKEAKAQRFPRTVFCLSSSCASASLREIRFPASSGLSSRPSRRVQIQIPKRREDFSLAGCAEKRRLRGMKENEIAALSSIRPSGCTPVSGQASSKLCTKSRSHMSCANVVIPWKGNRQRVPAPKCAQVNLRGSCSERAIVFVLGAADEGGQLSQPFGRRVRAKPDHCSCE